MSNHHFHRSVGPFTVLLFYYFISIRFQAEVFASRVAKPECRTTIFTGRSDSPRVFLHLGQPILHVGLRFCMSAKHIPGKQRPHAGLSMLKQYVPARNRPPVHCKIHSGQSWTTNDIRKSSVWQSCARCKQICKLVDAPLER